MILVDGLINPLASSAASAEKKNGRSKMPVHRLLPQLTIDVGGNTGNLDLPPRPTGMDWVQEPWIEDKPPIFTLFISQSGSTTTDASQAKQNTPFLPEVEHLLPRYDSEGRPLRTLAERLNCIGWISAIELSRLRRLYAGHDRIRLLVDQDGGRVALFINPHLPDNDKLPSHFVCRDDHYLVRLSGDQKRPAGLVRCH